MRLAKKLLLSAGTVTAISIPVFFAVSCDENINDTRDSSKIEMDHLYTIRVVTGIDFDDEAIYDYQEVAGTYLSSYMILYHCSANEAATRLWRESHGRSHFTNLTVYDSGDRVKGF